jgi:hypothetical protein
MRRLAYQSQQDPIGALLESILGDGSSTGSDPYGKGGYGGPPPSTGSDPYGKGSDPYGKGSDPYGKGGYGEPPSSSNAGGMGAPAGSQPPPPPPSTAETLDGILSSILGDGSATSHGGAPPLSKPGQLPASEPAAAARPVAAMDEPWMIGGVFLEHFVTIFDFDNARMGFAEPVQARRRLEVSEVHV